MAQLYLRCPTCGQMFDPRRHVDTCPHQYKSLDVNHPKVAAAIKTAKALK